MGKTILQEYIVMMTLHDHAWVHCDDCTRSTLWRQLYKMISQKYIVTTMTLQDDLVVHCDDSDYKMI